MFSPLFFLSWTLQAVFCGFAIAFAADGDRTPAQRLLPASATFVSLTCTGLFLLEERFFSSLMLNFSVSAADLILLFASLIVYWRRPGPLNEMFRLVTLTTFLTSLLWFTCSPSSLFLAVLFFPEAQVPTYHFWGGISFLAVLLLTSLLVGIVLTRHRPSTPPALNRKWGRPSFFALGLVGFGLIAVLYFAPPLQTTFVLQKRQHTMDLYHEMTGLCYQVKIADYERAVEGESSIYPADIDAKNTGEYLHFLASNGYLTTPLTVDAGEIEIGNVSRSDPDTTIFLRSTGTQLDIHTLIDQLGGVPNYAHGFLSFKKNGRGQFYRDEKRGAPEVGSEPPRTPIFLPN
jgi:hypothetical protein